MGFNLGFKGLSPSNDKDEANFTTNTQGRNSLLARKAWQKGGHETFSFTQ